MSARGFKLGVNCLVGKIEEKRSFLIPFFQPVHCVFGEQVSDISGVIIGYSLTINIQCGAVINPLTWKALPVAEPGLGLIGMAAHVPFPKKTGLVACVLKILWEECQISGVRCHIVHHAVGMGIQTGEDRCTAR